MTKNQNPYQGFTKALAFVDCLPVIICSITLGILSRRFNSRMFMTGIILIVSAGILKCIWKFLVAVKGIDIKILFYQMRIVMPAGFLLAFISLIINHNQISLSSIMRQMTAFPNNIFYITGTFGMLCMMWFAGHLDSSNARHNWIEQLTNTAAQLCFLLGVIL